MELTSKLTAMVRSTLSPQTPEELLRRLAQDAALAHDVTQHADSDSDDADGTTSSDSPLLDSYFESEPEPTSHWTSGRDRKSTTTPKDAFMMLLWVLKHYETWQNTRLTLASKLQHLRR
ncbi:hypothetical protein PHMEG_00032503 [Phytophthora megakarya]|uniref:Uncharacterized protein n=1 Tax=Phytophthora megakarya TaxID=4795 RepID=A0A225UW47_9STRA|nr:hypothetical protein PHMEG_00032503 [Phytophthora megakarya]